MNLRRIFTNIGKAASYLLNRGKFIAVFLEAFVATVDLTHGRSGGIGVIVVRYGKFSLLAAAKF